MKKLFLAVALVVAFAAPAMAGHQFPNPYATNSDAMGQQARFVVRFVITSASLRALAFPKRASVFWFSSRAHFQRN